jgi:hypothetical protein
MCRSISAKSNEAALARALLVIPPQVGRLVPLALCAAENQVDATVYAVTTGGLNQRQIDETTLGEATYGPLFAALLNFPRALLRYLVSNIPKSSSRYK